MRRVEQLLGLNKEEAEEEGDDEADPEKLPDAEIAISDQIKVLSAFYLCGDSG